MKLVLAILTLLAAGCAAESWRMRAPWNFPPAHEWNAPLETSWLNAVALYRRLTAPRGQIWDDLTQSYQPDLSNL
jgi:hypothetical protein